MIKSHTVRSRALLLGTAATLSLIGATTAHAQSGPSGMYNEAQSGTVSGVSLGQPTGMINEAQGGNAGAPLDSGSGMINEPSIVVTPPNSPTLARDTGVNGIGQMIIDQRNGFIGLCTGSLINPRTVIFAAHCVNETPDGNGIQNPWGYGNGANQLPIAFGFAPNNNVAGNSAFGQWLGTHATNTANFLYNVNQVLYNPDSVALGVGNNFLQGDVALASLDTPAANVPTWAVLLSALPAPSAISDTTGTGYHVIESGYGNNGIGTTGAIGGIDYRRRVAENYVGLLGSLDDIDSFIFGSPDGLPQNLYQLDFDSPNRSSQFDFNVFKDNALPYVAGQSPGEGITGGGDSGGPLILDRAYAKQLIIGVLSGGSRYFGAQASGSYGTSSFYQPLYLFWDYIAANNPYRYVGSKAGDANWTDASHWTVNLDPAYNILVNGQLVNGIPSVLGDGINGTAGKFGAICIDQAPNSDCYNVATGVETYNGTTYQYDPAGGTAGTTPLPAATLANGLPGATNFVPNNVNPNATTQTNARYFDVTLSANGTTTLSSAVTIDRFTMTTAVAKLNVTSAGSLTSLIDIKQLDGLVTNNGVINSVGDYFLMTGGVTGSGRFNAPFFTSALGMIAPGTTGTTGTLTFGGNLILASGNRYLVDLGANGVSDRIAVVATTFGTNGTTPTNGEANIGGQVGFAPVVGADVRAGNVYTILTSQGARTGTFATPSALSAILTPRFTYTANAVTVTLDAGTYTGVVGNTPVQNAYAAILDQNRSSAGTTYADLYGPLDLQNAATIRGTLEGLAPRTESLNTAVGTAAIDTMSRFYRDRLNSLQPGNLGGTLALVGQPLKLASAKINGLFGQPEVRSDAGDTIMQEGKLPEDVSGFIAGGYIDGHSRPMPGTVPVGVNNEFDGFYVAVGIEKEIGEHAIGGISMSYTDIDGAVPGSGSKASASLAELTIYGKVETAGGIAFDATASIGAFDTTTDRTATVVGTTYVLRANDQSLAVSGEVGLGKNFDLGQIKVGPRVSLRASRIDFNKVSESGGGPALTYNRKSLDSLQARAGLTAAGGGKFRPYLSGYYVHDFDDQPGVFNANLVGSGTAGALFALPSEDNDWYEVGGGIAFGSDKVELSIGADTTIDRRDVSNQSYHASVKFAF